MALEITSPFFKDGGMIPRKFTCQGEDVNPQLDISGVPANARSLVLIMDDPDAPMGTWDHWVVWNIPPDVKSIPENSVPEGAIQGRNSWGKNEYGGPCPPHGVHRYFFKLYALDILLNISPKSTKKDVEKAMKGHIIEKAELIGKYVKE